MGGVLGAGLDLPRLEDDRVRPLLLDRVQAAEGGARLAAQHEVFYRINGIGAMLIAFVAVVALANNGLAGLPSELPEVLGLSDRVIVLHEGRLEAEFSRDEATPERVMAAATGSSDE